MFFTKLIHRKLSSLLQPWLRDEPELELKLGFINSIAIVKNLRFNNLALNRILDQESSSVYVKELNIEHLSLRFSNWSSTAFSLEVRGVDVTLSAREIKERGLQKDKKTSRSASENVKKNISAIDPEGGAVHDVLERILNTTPSRSRIATAIVNLILNHCYLQMVGINLQLHLPISSDSFAYISELKELNAESLYFHQGCLLRGLVGLVFRPLKKSSFVISGSGFEIGYKRNDHINHVCSSNELLACAKLDELQLVYFDIHSLELNILFSPVDLAIFAVLAELSPKGSKHVRNGRLLWKLVSRRIGHVISAPSLSLHNLVTHVSLWLRYVNAYAHLLFLLGYSADHLLKRYALKISQDETFLASVKNNWEVITDIEIELPAEAIAQARRIARYRAAVNVQRDEDSDKKFSVSSHLKIFSKILPLLACVWKAMYRIFHLIAQLLFLFRLSTKDPESSVNVRQGIVSEYSYPQRCFCLNLEKLFITFYPEHSAEPVNQRLESQTGISYSDFLSFCLSVDALILMYTEDISEKSFLFSCGQLKVTSSSYIRAPLRRSSSMDSTASVKGHRRKGRVTNAKIVLWGEPAELFTLSETNKSSPTDHAEGAFDPVLEDFLGEMWFNWKRFCMKFDESEIEYSENPWLLCETKSFLTYPDLKNPDSGFWKCNLTVGKLNLALEYSSLLSMALLLRQIQHVATWTKGNAMPRAPSGSTPTIADQPEISCNDKFESCAGGIKMALCRMLPEKHIQIGVLIAGPHIQMSLRKIAFQNRRAEKNHLVGQDDFHLEFDVHNIKFVALPTSKSDSTSFVRIPGSDDAKLECIRLQKPQIIAKSDDEKYASQGWISICAYLRIDGLNTYLVDVVRNQRSLIFALKPISFHFSSSREYVHSLTTTVNAFAAALCGMAGGFTIISFIDEMHALFQVVAGLFSEVSYACNGFDYVIYVPFQEFIQQDIVSLEHENGESTVKGASFICTSTLFSLSGTFKLEPMDIFCHKYRIREKVSFVKNIDASSGKMFSDVLLDCGVWISVYQTCMDISCEEGKIEVVIDFSGIKSQLIRYEGHLGNVLDHLVFRNLLLQPHNCLHELSLSNCIFTMWFCRRHDALSPHAESDTVGGSHSGSNIPHSVGNSTLTSESEKSTAWSHHFVQKVGFDPNIFIPAPSHWLLLNIAFGEVLMTNCLVKNVLVGSHQFNKLLSSLSVGGEFQSVSCAIQMIMSTVSSFYGISSKEMSRKTTERHQSIKQESSNGFKAMVPNGAIVAIQDVDQHTYFAVEDGENKYTLAGAIHYSLVGERALFRVKYHKQKRWMSSVLWFSLISLYAKNDLGEPLRLNCHSGSCFVDISSSDDSSCTLWRMLPCDSESYRGDVDWEAQNQLVKDTFYLVNKKNDCAVAFIDGVPEFVKKPGNSFKFKEFNNLAVTRDLVVSDGYSFDASGTNVSRTEHDDEDKTSEKSGGLPCIHIKIDKVALTVVHELLDTKDRLPLFCACVSDTQIAVQSLSTKARVMSTSRALLSYFDAQRNLWRELVQPVEICIYYRSSFQIQGSEALWHRVPLRIYCRIKEQFQIFLTELSLDILLFVVGKLDLAGPYLIRSSRILANCCKVENQSGLNLHCHFDEQQSVTVGRKQSASIFLRNSTLVNQAPDSSSVVSIQLSLGSFTTSPIYLSLLESRSLTWRTRIVSAQDSRTFPGPFIVVDISRTSEDGLSIVVSPLIRVHNETEFSMELRFRRVQEQEDDFASILLKPGHTIDDSMAMFDAVSFSGGLKKALMSLSVGNFLFSFRPGSSDGLISSKSSLSAEWSEELTGGKAVRLSGIFDKLSYEVRRALSVQSEKCSFSTAHCVLKAGDIHVASMHFLIQSIGRNVPIIEPDKSSDGFESRSLPIALQEQKEIFLLPTVLVTNLLHLDIHVLLSETDLCTNSGSENIGKQATIPCGSKADFYANPAIMYFIITLPAFRSSCKPLNSSDWVNKLLKHKNDVRYLDIDLDFGAGKYFASLRLSRGQRGILEATIFTSYTLRNETDVSLLFYAPNQKPLSRDEVQKSGFGISPEIGLLLSPKSTGSWFLKSHKLRFRLLDDHSSEALLDLDILSGLTEIKLEIDEGSGVKYFSKFGVSMGPSSSKVAVPSQTTTIVPRHVVLNETEERIIVRQCYLEDDRAGMFPINSKERKTLQLHDGVDKKRAFSSFENFIRKHRNDNDKSLIYIQFQLDESELGWSGPLCISSLGRFFLKFRKKSDQVKELGKSIIEFAAVHVAEEGSSLVVHFHKPPNVNLPYRIENCLRGASVTYYQKESSEAEVLGSECSVDYVWDDLTLPHKLVVLINDMHTLREINLDKVRPWKPFFKLKQHRSLASYAAFGKKLGDQRTSFGEFNGMEIVKVGYEVRADGPTRILRICESSDSHKRNTASKFCAKIQLRISYFALHLLEHRKQDMDESDASSYAPIVVGRLGNINLDSVFRDQQKYNQISVQSLNVEHKRLGAPFAAMLRRHQLGYSESNDCVLKIVCILLSNSSNVKQVKYSSIILQPVDLNLDEETLMSIASFWRTSLSDSNTQSRQFYFDHFEILPIKIIANFLPGDSYSSYNSAQETVRSLLHSVVKVPSIKNMVVELNGVLVTHALITVRELLNKCGQHYLWYAMRSIYIAKGSPLLPPAFASIFDDSASSSLDVFFDPSYGLTNLPGLTLGTFKFISKCIDGKGFSGTKRYFGDLGKTLKTAGSNVLFAAVTEISDSVLRGAETSGFDGLVSGFHHGILKLAMEPSLLGSALIGGGPDRNINLDRSPGIDELYIEGYLQAMLDSMYRQEYLRVRVIDNQVFLKNLPPNNALINEIMDRVKGFLESEGLLKGDPSRTSRPSRQLRGENEWKIGPTVLTLCEHLFVSFAIRMLRRRADKLIAGIKLKKKSEADNDKAVVPVQRGEGRDSGKFIWKWGIGKFVLSGIIAYIDGRLCRGIPNPIARRIVGGFLLSFLDKRDNQ
ncbi:uncharacterized protein LOC18037025 isoform X3 [Citrus clementina]|uniref:uncharacterized protein LOC18037025 isoform X3 n=1 Tax=Citrus clementina TaxID=85681 RepID=UPI000CED478E|nr:uncharacterized protein LOC18037025 isoform X3 [Citrus x clementina]